LWGIKPAGEENVNKEEEVEDFVRKEEEIARESAARKEGGFCASREEGYRDEREAGAGRRTVVRSLSQKPHSRREIPNDGKGGGVQCGRGGGSESASGGAALLSRGGEVLAAKGGRLF